MFASAILHQDFWAFLTDMVRPTKKNKTKSPGKKRVATSSSAEPEVEVLDAGEADYSDIDPESTLPEIVTSAGIDEHLPSTGDTYEQEEVEERGLVRYDSLSAYLKEISKYTPLSKEEESALAIRYFKEKDVEAAYKIISSNLWLVVKIAREYERAARTLLDIIQEGNIGLMEAVKNFDPYRGVRFPTYAVWWIKAYIIRFVIANWRLVKIGTTQAQRKLFFNLKKEKEKLEREGFYPGPKLLAEKLNVKEQEVVEMEQRLGSSDMSFDSPISEESDGNLLSILPSNQPSAEDLLSKKQLESAINRSIEKFSSTLKDKELIILRERMLAEEKATLQEMADKLSLSKERVRQIEERIKEKLKTYLTDELGDSISSIDIDSH